LCLIHDLVLVPVRLRDDAVVERWEEVLELLLFFIAEFVDLSINRRHDVSDLKTDSANFD